MVSSIRPYDAQNLAKIVKNFFFDPKISPIFFCWRRKVKRLESSETRSRKFSRRSEPSSRRKRPSKVVVAIISDIHNYGDVVKAEASASEAEPCLWPALPLGFLEMVAPTTA